MSPMARIDGQDAPLLLLKKATSSLDGESGALVRTVLEQPMRRRTTLVIPHRLATRLSRDRIPVKSSNKASTQTFLPRTGSTARLARLQCEHARQPYPRAGVDLIGRKLGLVGRESRPDARNARKRAHARRRKILSVVLAGDPIENLRGGYRFLRRMGIQGPGNRAPALLDDFLGKSARFGFIPEFAGRARQPALSVIALRRYVRAVGNVPDKWLGQAISLEQFPSAAISEGNHRRDPFPL
jgi:hypothetical protein